MRLKHLFVPASGLAIVLTLLVSTVKGDYSEYGSGEEYSNGIIPDTSQFSNARFYKDLENCHECKHGKKYQDDIKKYECSMTEYDPVSLFKL